MIRIIGTAGSSEYAVAQDIAAALAKLWPGLESAASEDELVLITAGAKISGYRISDIDVVIAARLRRGRAFAPRKALNTSDGRRISGGVEVTSLVAAIEVKDHDPGDTRISGQAVEVRYSRGGPPQWHNATEQNVQQTHSLKQYFDDQTAGVFVHRALVMRGYDKPPAPGTVGRVFDGPALLTALVETAPPRPGHGPPRLQAGPPDRLERALQAPVFRQLRPSSLDRRRMDRIITRSALVEEHLPHLGSKLIRFRGRGGTGKTLMLLQLAWRAYEERAARSVVLTFNHALTSDIRRLLALMGVPSGASEGGIAVKTVMGFVSGWLSELGVLDVPEFQWTRSNYEAACATALEMIRAGAVSSADIAAAKRDHFERFDFDLVIADEAQDWPEAELELLKALYTPERICLADGLDQLVRGRAAHWEAGVDAGSRLTVPLKRCLRMKSNLAVFANAVAERAGLDWQVQPNDEAAGGKVILSTRPLVDRSDLIRRMIIQAKEQGNAPVDLLFCVPPDDVQESATGRRSRLGHSLNGAGFEIWDGTSLDDRKEFPRSDSALRLVQYASCRGLEGWTVFLEGFDAPWTDVFGAGGSDPWMRRLVPLTRAIDTLVIGIADQQSGVSQLLKRVAESYSDIVQID